MILSGGELAGMNGFPEVVHHLAMQGTADTINSPETSGVLSLANRPKFLVL